MKGLPGDQVRALPMLITGRLRADRVRQTSSTSTIVVDDRLHMMITMIFLNLLLLLRLRPILIHCKVSALRVVTDQGAVADRHLTSYCSQRVP